jgi:hypothetical protein
MDRGRALARGGIIIDALKRESRLRASHGTAEPGEVIDEIEEDHLERHTSE